MKNSLLLLAICFAFVFGNRGYSQIPDQDLASYLSPSTPNLPRVSAHRGGRCFHGLPENSLSLFRYVTSAIPAFIECDIQMSADSVLFLLHDDSLQRTTTGIGLARSYTWGELQEFTLVDDYKSITDEKIPSLESILRWAKGNAILMLDIKEDVPIELLVQLIREYQVENNVLLIAYTLEDAVMLHQYAPDLVLSATMNEISDIEEHDEAGIPLRQCVAFTGTRLQSPELYKALREKGILSILGTMNEADHQFRGGSSDVYGPLYEAGIDILATDHPIHAAKLLEE